MTSPHDPNYQPPGPRPAGAFPYDSPQPAPQWPGQSVPQSPAPQASVPQSVPQDPAMAGAAPGAWGGAPYGGNVLPQAGGFGHQPPGGGGGWDVPPPSGGGKKGLLIGGIIGALVLALLSAGGVYAFTSYFGGGAQPEERVPATAIAYAEVDLNPSAGQQLNFVRFARKFPELKSKFNEGDRDVKRQIWNALAKDDPEASKFDYEKDVKPWLGDRAAIAVLPGEGDEPVEVMGLLQLTDEAKARTMLSRLSEEASGDKPAFVVDGGYVIYAKTEAKAKRFNEQGKKNPLSEDEDFQNSLDQLGEPGVTSGYLSLDRARSLLDSPMVRSAPGVDAPTLKAARESLKGRVAWGVRFSGDDLEMVAVGSGLESYADTTTSTGTGIENLPSSTVAAIGAGNMGESVKANWDRIVTEISKTQPSAKSQLAEFERGSGLSLPDDLATVLGSKFSLAVDKADLETNPHFGARIETDPAKFMAVVNKLLKVAGLPDLASAGVEVRQFGDGVAVGRSTDSAYVSQLAKQGTLGDSAGFKAALPDAAKADAAAYIDVDVLADSVSTGVDRTSREQLRVIDSVGMTVVSDKPGEFTFKLLVVTK